MDPLKVYSIPILGLKNGPHQFVFELDKRFFEHFEMSPIREGSFTVVLMLDKRDDLSTLDFDIQGYIDTQCDRCLAAIKLPVSSQQSAILKRGIGTDEDPDLIYMAPEAHEFNVAQLIYDYVCLSLPLIQAFDCENQQQPPCNQDVLKHIQKEESYSQDVGPWDNLKNIKL
ncbi:MAG: DUF177 domain-containing protein [Bacteroidota bacterium]|nr:DUF177 domain-containing protein [Bacteroidota bacterium]